MLSKYLRSSFLVTWPIIATWGLLALAGLENHPGFFIRAFDFLEFGLITSIAHVHQSLIGQRLLAVHAKGNAVFQFAARDNIAVDAFGLKQSPASLCSPNHVT